MFEQFQMAFHHCREDIRGDNYHSKRLIRTEEQNLRHQRFRAEQRRYAFETLFETLQTVERGQVFDKIHGQNRRVRFADPAVHRRLQGIHGEIHAVSAQFQEGNYGRYRRNVSEQFALFGRAHHGDIRKFLEFRRDGKQQEQLEAGGFRQEGVAHEAGEHHEGTAEECLRGQCLA